MRRDQKDKTEVRSAYKECEGAEGYYDFLMNDYCSWGTFQEYEGSQ